MSIGISKTRVENLLRSNGVNDEDIIEAVARVINKNNQELERDVKRMIDDAIRHIR